MTNESRLRNGAMRRAGDRAARAALMPLLALSNCVMWMAAGAVLAVTHAARAADSVATVGQENITVSLPVFMTAVGMTAVCTWTVAKYDHARNDKIRRLERALEALAQRMGMDGDLTRTPHPRDRGPR